MPGKEISEEERFAVRKAVRAGKTAEEARTEINEKFGGARSVKTIRTIATSNGFPFPRSGQPASGPTGPYSAERTKAIRDGVLAAKARREGIEA